jgi:hypothetical protein
LLSAVPAIRIGVEDPRYRSKGDALVKQLGQRLDDAQERVKALKERYEDELFALGFWIEAVEEPTDTAPPVE